MRRTMHRNNAARVQRREGRMRVRLFWQLLATFVILIIFGVGGTAALIRVRFGQIAAEARPYTRAASEELWASQLADYYQAHGQSWKGVGTWFRALEKAGEWTMLGSSSYVLLDADGQTVVLGGTDDQDLLKEDRSRAGSPVIVNGKVVGRLVLGDADSWQSWGPMMDVPTEPGDIRVGALPATNVEVMTPDYQQRIFHTFPLVALGIGSIMLGLAVIMSRRISAPLASMTRAAQQVASGELAVAVPGSSILEVDTLARTFNSMAATLRREDQLRRNMTADIAHELRTPLTVIKGKLEGILDGVYPGTAAHIVPVLEEANLLERLVEDLRLLSLAEARELPLHRELVDIGGLLDDTRHSFVREAAAQQVELTVERSASETLVDVDPQRMQQVLGNLVANSLRHTLAGGSIQLRAEQNNGTVRVAVQDTGRGIDAEDLPHIFDRFWRGDRARSRQSSGGAGLGLAIARQLVEAQGGQISAQSIPGQGTTMVIELPVAGQEIEVT